eukprot:3936408-Rhodomonas_salina.1
MEAEFGVYLAAEERPDRRRLRVAVACRGVELPQTCLHVGIQYSLHGGQTELLPCQSEDLVEDSR